jgi:cephalosporin hydroxylase
VIDTIAKMVKNSKVLVTLDSLHTKKHVLKELNLYSHFVSLVSYIVVQDTYWTSRRNGRTWIEEGGPGEAIEEFLKNNKNFEIDHSKGKYIISQYPSGFLKRVR